MNPPATVKKVLFAVPIAVAAFAIAGFDLPLAAVLGQSRQSTQTSAQQNLSKQANSKADGLFLYGETPQPKQVSKGYVVFQRQKGEVVGAMYAPNSEFECFTGSQKDNTLDVKSLGIGEPQVAEAKINLSNLHPIKSISAQEQHIISVCQQEAAASIDK